MKINSFLRSQGKPDYIDEITIIKDHQQFSKDDENEKDECFECINIDNNNYVLDSDRINFSIGPCSLGLVHLKNTLFRPRKIFWSHLKHPYFCPIERFLGKD